MSLNTCAIMGRICHDLELKSTPSGVSVISFTIACDRNYQPSGNAERLVDFIDCVAWRGTAEFISRYFRKGSMIAVEGSIQTRNYTDKDGNKRKIVEVVANNVSFCGSKENSSQAVTGNRNANLNVSADDDIEEIDIDDDLPF